MRFSAVYLFLSIASSAAAAPVASPRIEIHGTDHVRHDDTQWSPARDMVKRDEAPDGTENYQRWAKREVSPDGTENYQRWAKREVSPDGTENYQRWAKRGKSAVGTGGHME